ncbi:MAG: rhomboid family intramembrane serine protease [Pseudobdellovibrionaceae bacterium]|nr:rhomboid family intramembrane serine protease [Bdellovibrionales bacterium]USN48973.1 MAG: rhomboid family intramembrane serine protease [Pseudobdellovibrionaceae bacterium]
MQPAPVTPMVKKLLILNVGIWLLLVIGLQELVLHSRVVFEYFGLIPDSTVFRFYLWQPFTYMFLHSGSEIFHILFNMLLLWWLGAELELRWGSRFFLTYYLVCGVGAAVIYTVGAILYFWLTNQAYVLGVPVVGASGAVYGLLLAYGMIFGDRVMYFMMMFPMKAKHLVMILGGIELVTLLSSGPTGPVATLCHLGGLATGFLYLLYLAQRRGGGSAGRKKPKRKYGRKLRLVVDNDRLGDDQGDRPPRYWN